jgi:hypothetical protein
MVSRPHPGISLSETPKGAWGPPHRFVFCAQQVISEAQDFDHVQRGAPMTLINAESVGLWRSHTSSSARSLQEAC